MEKYLQERLLELNAEREAYQREAEAKLLAYSAVIGELEKALEWEAQRAARAQAEATEGKAFDEGE